VKSLLLRNTTNGKLAYKVKTTAPKLYCVRPNASIINPGESMEISIIRQAKEQPKANEKSKDKFLVLSSPVEDGVDANSDFSALWSKIEETAKDSIDNKKIRVNYVFNTAEVGGAGGAGAGAPPAHTSTEPENSVKLPRAEPETNASNAKQENVDFSTSIKAPIDSLKEAVSTGYATSGDSTLSSRTEAQRAVQEASDLAQKKISAKTVELKARSDAAKLSASREPGFATATKQPMMVGQTGVPLHIVLVLALIAFFIGWKLF
jgi:vesicle-associated membrane protein-associated protein A